ncbi:class I SAM-dependent methyltransferase [bacterium]|nr:class I SAM-dependent methyltransferase [bacterium]
MFLNRVGKENESNREEWIKNILSQIPSKSRILDAGAGECKYKKFCAHLTYVSQDFCQYKGKGNQEGLQKEKWDTSEIDIISDITSIPEKDGSFDAIMCIEVFEHLPDPIKAIKEFSRLLKNNGYLIITAPFCSLTHFAPYHFYSGYNKYFFEHHLPESNFEIIEIIPNGNYFSYIAQEVRRISSVTKNYTSLRYVPFMGLVNNILLLFLSLIEKKDKNSSKLLCFGYHVLAHKKVAM